MNRKSPEKAKPVGKKTAGTLAKRKTKRATKQPVSEEIGSIDNRQVELFAALRHPEPHSILGAHPTPARQLALLMAARASESARRGDFPGAMRILDEAERIDPGLPMLCQYRSNVAYLMGDTKAAIAALEKGLQLEPDNALFKENLHRLRDRAGRKK